ncbi:MAG: rod shape-determining protein [Lewinellaceae bacterium]|nr:rod shape-determining protein [Lewinellaceae bacterium]
MVDDQVIVDEPSIVAMNRRTGETIAVGHRAMQMHEKTPRKHKNRTPAKRRRNRRLPGRRGNDRNA